MRKFNVIIQGTSPLLQHRFSEEDKAQVQSGTSTSIKKNDPEEMAERAAYRLPSGELYQPSDHIERSCVQAAGLHKIGRRSAKSVAGAAFCIAPREIPHGLREYVVDSRRAVIPSTGASVVRHRPRLDAWRLSFTLEIDDELIAAPLAKQILIDAGKRIGIGDFRPSKGGPFGRFTVIAFEEMP
jgi:hypothetical protein